MFSSTRDGSLETFLLTVIPLPCWGIRGMPWVTPSGVGLLVLGARCNEYDCELGMLSGS